MAIRRVGRLRHRCAASPSGPATRQLLVLPVVDRVAAPSGGRIDDLLVSTSHNLRAADRGEDFASLRGYVPGDDLRKVHWPTSARRGTLMVRKNDEARQPRCTLVLDVRAQVHDDETLERAISAAASILTAAIRNGDEARLVTTSGLDSLNGAGEGHLASLLQELALIVPGAGGSLATTVAALGSEHEALVVVTSSAGDPGGAVTLGRPRRRALMVVFGAASGPEAWNGNGSAYVVVPPSESFATCWGELLGPPNPPARGRRAGRGSHRWRPMTAAEVAPRRVADEVALGLVSVAVVAGFARLFDRATFYPPLLGVALLAHLAAALTRRSRSALAGPIMLVAGLFATIDLTSWSTTTWGVPTPATFRAAGHELRVSWHSLSSVVAPTAPTTGFLLAAAVAIWVAAWAGDRLAFRLRRSGRGARPDHHPVPLRHAVWRGPDTAWTCTTLFGAAALVYVLVERTVRSGTRSDGVRAGPGDTGWRTIGAGTTMTAVALALGSERSRWSRRSAPMG